MKQNILIASGVLLAALVFSPSNMVLNALSLSLMVFGLLINLKT